MSRSVHDNLVYLQVVDHENARIVLHTLHPQAEPEFTDVVFTDVIVHHFEQQTVGPESSVVLFDIEEEDPLPLLSHYEDLLKRTKNHGWPVTDYAGLEDLASKLTARGVSCFRVQGTAGLEGFVFAKELQLIARAEKAGPPDQPPQSGITE